MAACRSASSCKTAGHARRSSQSGGSRQPGKLKAASVAGGPSSLIRARYQGGRRRAGHREEGVGTTTRGTNGHSHAHTHAADRVVVVGSAALGGARASHL
eukprot:5058997-Prymnesium_polylepis.1